MWASYSRPIRCSSPACADQIRHEDPRLINYLLEHSYLWLRDIPLHRDLWTPPFFYPTRDTFAFSDTLLGAAPLYWFWRLAGIPADTSFQLWLVTCFPINFAVFFVFLRRTFSLAVVPSTIGAFLYAFGAPRVSDIGHPQLLPHFFTIVALMVLGRLLEGRQRRFAAQGALWSILAVAIAAQFYTSVYMAWFLSLGGGIALLWGLRDRSCRPALAGLLRRDWGLMTASLTLAAVLIAPLLLRYLELARQLGPRTMFEVSLALPTLGSWVYLGPESWVYHWQPRLLGLVRYGAIEPAKRIGVGWMTLPLCLWGLVLGRDRPAVRILGLTGLTLAILVTPLPRFFLLGLGVAEWAFLSVIVWRKRNRLAAEPFELILLGLLSCVSFPLSSIVLACAMLAIGSATRLVTKGGLSESVPRFTAILAFAFLLLTTFQQSPDVLVTAAVLDLSIVAMGRLAPVRPGRLSLVAMVVATATVLILVPGTLTLWKYLHTYIPGGGVIRVPTRAIFLILIPLSIGLALAWEWLEVKPGWKYVFPLASLHVRAGSLDNDL